MGVISYEAYVAAADYIRERIPTPPQVGITLGSGLASLADEVQNPVVIPYGEIPHFPRSTVEGHPGRMVLGTLAGMPVAVMQGRVHFYEGYSLPEVTFYVRVLRLLGVHTLILTNAAGGLNPDFRPGDLMIIVDHINLPGLVGHSPLWGPNEDRFGPRFVAMNKAYDRELRQLALEVAAELGIPVRQGVYVGLGGPTFETPAEVRMLRSWGGDAVGMSTVHETVVAVHAGMRVLGISTITNVAVDRLDAEEEADHEEVLATGQAVTPRLAALIKGVLARLADASAATAGDTPR